MSMIRLMQVAFAVVVLTLFTCTPTALADSVQGYVYYDANGNGIKDAGEVGFAGVTVSATNAVPTVTDANGFYSFAVGAGSLSITSSGPGGTYHSTTPEVVTLFVSGTGNTYNVNFGYSTAPAGGTLQGYVYYDANTNGIKDAGEVGFAGVTVTAKNLGLTLTTVTDANGFYSFAVGTGTWSITSSGPGGTYHSTTPAVATLSVSGAGNTYNVDFGYSNTSTAQQNNIPTLAAGVTASLNVVGCSAITGAAFNTAPAGAPVSFPYGLLGFTLTGCAGPVLVTVTYSQNLPAGATFYKYLSGSYGTYLATLGTNSVTFWLTDGGAGDGDGLANGSITDPGGIGVPLPPPSIPTLSERGMILLASLLAIGAILTLRNRQP